MKDDKLVELKKHGGDKGKCRSWALSDHDYITSIAYIYDKEFGNLTSAKIGTFKG